MENSAPIDHSLDSFEVLKNSFTLTTIRQESQEVEDSSSIYPNFSLGEYNPGIQPGSQQEADSMSMARAIDELTSPFKLSQEFNEDEESTEEINETEAVLAMEDQRLKASKLLDDSRSERKRLESLINNVKEMTTLKNKHPSPEEEELVSDSNNSKGSEPLEKNEDKTLMKGLIATLDTHLSLTPNRIIQATLLGFSLAFVFFFIYTLIFEQILHTQMTHYENSTRIERLAKNEYKQGHDSMREQLMHRTYEEARQHVEELRECRKSLGVAREQVVKMETEKRFCEKKVMEFQKAAKDIGDKERNNVAELTKNLMALKEQNKALKEQVSNLGGGVAGLVMALLVCFWLGVGTRK